MKIKTLILFSFVLLLSSCAAHKNILYFQDASDGSVEKVFYNTGRIRLQPDDVISIIVKSRDMNLTNLFNLPYYTQRLGSTTEFTNNYSKKGTRYLIFAPTGSAAKQMAKKIVAKKAMQYAGLAKRAIGFLIMKTCTTNVNDIVSPKVNATAKAVTHKREAIATSKQGDGGKYALMLEDSLRYALDAIRGGRQAVDVAMKKAMNKAVSQINHKVKYGFLSKGKMPTPFPEVVKRK